MIEEIRILLKRAKESLEEAGEKIKEVRKNTTASDSLPVSLDKTITESIKMVEKAEKDCD